MAWEAVIGLECHVQLKTRSKMFCGCPNTFGAPPNTNVCPVCLGLPGALPRTNERAIEFALRLGLALGCRIAPESVFARKNYFYPDMPKNYQVTQYDRPLCEGGELTIVLEGGPEAVRLTRIHCEEDAGKSFHPERHGDRRLSRVDFNRAGVPLLELVTEPVLESPEACAAFLTALRRLVRWLGISDGDMEKGQLRCDANVSIRPAGATTLGTKTELKNLNTIKGVERGVAAEIARQTALVTEGGRVSQATLLYDADRDRLAIMRSKEHAHDYRYFPEPDLPVLRVSEPRIAAVRAAAPELPWAREARFRDVLGLTPYDAGVLTQSRELSDYLEELIALGVSAKSASNWVSSQLLRYEGSAWREVSDLRSRFAPPKAFATLISRVESVSVTATAAKGMLEEVMLRGADPHTLFVTGGAPAISGDAKLRPLVRAVMEENASVVAQVLAGEERPFGFLVGQVMKKSGGQAVPQEVQKLLREELAGRSGS